MLLEIFSIVAPVFLLTAAGYGWARSGVPFDTPTISTMVVWFGTPCLVFHTLTTMDLPIATFGRTVLAAICALSGSYLLGWIWLRLWRLDVSTYLPCIGQPNSGNMGLPLVLFAFGESGLALGLSFFFVAAVSQFSAGISVAARSFSPLLLLRQPLIWAVIAALVVVSIELPMPRWLLETTRISGGLVIPAMLLMLGHSLASLRVRDLGETAVVAAGRLLIGVGAGVVVVQALDLEGAQAGAVIIQSAMPAAVFNYLLAHQYGNSPERVAAVVVLSTGVSLLTLPLLVALALSS